MRQAGHRAESPVRGAILTIGLGYLPLLAACSDSGGPPTQSGPEGCAAAVVPYPDSPSQSGDVRHVHDPSIVRHADHYYVYSTNDGIPIRRSADLVHWEWAGRVFPNQLPPWASGAIPGVEAPWAPDVAYFSGRYHLYYSLSTFGSQRSAIGLTVNATLDPNAPEYGWLDQGSVLQSWPGVSNHNAIDPTVVFDEGEPWLAWGSWAGGIMLRRIDETTGMLSATDTMQHTLATRTPAFGQNAIEGPYILRHDGSFFLFVAFDLCCRGAESTYNVRVGRSSAVTGPYIDMEGVPMLQGGGTAVLRSYGRIRGPGHGSVLTDGGRHYFAHHFYDPQDGGVPQLQVRPIYWDAEGWPLIGGPYQGHTGGGTAGETGPAGEWGFWVDSEPATRVRLLADGRMERCDAEGSWTFDSGELTVRWPTIAGAERTHVGVFSESGSEFVGRAQDGSIVRGYRLGTN